MFFVAVFPAVLGWLIVSSWRSERLMRQAHERFMATMQQLTRDKEDGQ